MNNQSTEPDGEGERVGWPWLLLDERELATGPEDPHSTWWVVGSHSSYQAVGPLSSLGCVDPAMEPAP